MRQRSISFKKALHMIRAMTSDKGNYLFLDAIKKKLEVGDNE